MIDKADGLSRVDALAAKAALQPVPQRRAWADAAWADEIEAPDLEGVRAARWSMVCPSRFAMATLDDVEYPALDAWCRDPKGRNLLLFGPVGAGKTHAALAAARVRHGAGHDVAFRPMVDLMDDLRPNGSEGALDDVCDVDLLVLDDLGVERMTDWVAERLHLIVNRRWLNERPIIATSNLSPKGLEEQIGPRVYSRLCHDAVAVGLTGDDRRRRR